MIYAFWFLALCFLVIVVLLMTIVFYHPAKPTQEDYTPLIKDAEASRADLNEGSLDLLREIDIKWPHLSVMLTKENTDHVLFLKWEGTVKEEKILLFYLTDGDQVYALLEALNRINENHLPPALKPVIALGKNRDKDLAAKEISRYAHGLADEIFGAIVDGRGIVYEKRHDFFTILSGRKAAIEWEASGSGAADWLDGFSPSITDNFADGNEVLAKELAAEVTLPMKLQACFNRKKFRRNLAAVFPELKEQYFPSAFIRGNHITVYALSDKQIDHAIRAINKDAREHGIDLKMICETSAVPMAAYSPLDEKIAASLKSCIAFCRPVNLYGNPDEFTLIPGVSVRGIAVKKAGDDLTGETAVCFYQNLLS